MAGQSFQRSQQIGNYRQTTTLIFVAIAASALVPLALYRIAIGEVYFGILDACIAAAVCLPLVYARRTGNSATAGIALCAVDTVACAAVLLTHSGSGVLWTYIVFATNYAVTDRRAALAANLALLLVAYSRQSFLLQDTADHFVYPLTAGLMIAFGYITSRQLEKYTTALAALATEDPLTGLANRRTMEWDLAAAVSAHAVTGAIYGLAVLDLDRFKQVNDAHGHAVGDAVLRTLAELLRAELRASDRVYRFGGEEFVLLLPARTAADARAAMERMRAALAGRLESPSGPVTASIGLAILTGPEQWQDWFSRADLALYEAKRVGRDALVVATDVDFSHEAGAADADAEEPRRRKSDT